MTILVDAIPVTGFAVRLLGNADFGHLDPQVAALATTYATIEDLWKGYHRIGGALGVIEKASLRTEDAVAHLAAQALAAGHAPVTIGSTRAFRTDGKVFWTKSCIEGEPETLRIMPDFGAFSWCEDGCNLDIDLAFPDLPGIEALHEDFAQWHRPFDLADWQHTEPMLPGFDWPPFHAAGIALSKRLKQMLGDRCQVIYQKPDEDPDSDRETFHVMAIRP